MRIVASSNDIVGGDSDSDIAGSNAVVQATPRIVTPRRI